MVAACKVLYILYGGYQVGGGAWLCCLLEVGTVRFEQTERLAAGHDGVVAGLRAYALVDRCGLHDDVFGRARQELFQLCVNLFRVDLPVLFKGRLRGVGLVDPCEALHVFTACVFARRRGDGA